jgi:hypothetical protein
VEKLRVQPWNEKGLLTHLEDFLDDRSNQMIGRVIIKQRRIRSEPCSTHVLNGYHNRTVQCQGDLNDENEEHRVFLPRWTDDDPSKKKINQTLPVSQAFRPRPGGYVLECRRSIADLRADLSALRRLSWIDHRTRLITIHLSVYNPNIHMFTSGVLQAQFLPTGQVIPTARFEPIDLQS